MSRTFMQWLRSDPNPEILGGNDYHGEESPALKIAYERLQDPIYQEKAKRERETVVSPLREEARPRFNPGYRVQDFSKGDRVETIYGQFGEVIYEPWRHTSYLTVRCDDGTIMQVFRDQIQEKIF